LSSKISHYTSEENKEDTHSEIEINVSKVMNV